MEEGGEGGSKRGTLGTNVVALGWGQWDRWGGSEVMGKGWVTLRGTLGTDVTLQWGHWGHDGWHHTGDSGTDVVALRWGHWGQMWWH